LAQPQEPPATQPAQQAPTGVGHEAGVNEQKPAGEHGPAAQGQDTHAAGAEHAAEAEHGEEHGGGVVDTIARLVNFAILAGTLVYLLKSPIRTYLADRGTQIRSDLVNAAAMKETAAAQIAEIERKMQALPGELETLRAQGAQEIAAEEARIRAAAAAERDRLLDQARREIDLQVKVAERELVAHAAGLAVGVASERIRKNITDEDQKRLVDRYVQQLPK
jgi:F-type H+-transporting ATPase subunit b